MRKNRIITNFLEDASFKSIQKTLLSPSFPWYYNSEVAHRDNLKEKTSHLFYMTHLFYLDHKFNSDQMAILAPLLNKLAPKALIRIKANLYTHTSTLHQHPPHIDYNFPHQAAIYSINTNDGFTVLKNNNKIKSKANQIAFFDGSEYHSSTTCTNQQIRVNIGINYF